MSYYVYLEFSTVLKDLFKSKNKGYKNLKRLNKWKNILWIIVH